MKSKKIIKIIVYIIAIISIACLAAYIYFYTKSSPNEISIEEKISQMIVIGYDKSNKSLKNLEKDINNGNISGVIFYKRNIKNPEQIKNQIEHFNKISKAKYPLFMMLDQEGGKVSRITDNNGFKVYPSAKEVSKFNKEKAHNAYYEMATDLKNIGINFNVAPCVDVKINPKSSIASDSRIYSENPKVVTDYSLEFINAHNAAKVITAIKHFPGLGNAEFDTHKTLPDITNSWKETELIPFKSILEKYPKEPVMVGHVINKKIDSNNISSLSSKTISVLNNSMNHEGIVIADAIDMSAVEDYSIEDILVKSINSGVNLFIFPNHVQNENNSKIYMRPEFFIKTVKEAINSGKISTDKIDTSYNKIIDLKQMFILNDLN